MGTIPTTAIVSREPDRSGNFVADGTADNVEIVAALTYVNVIGGGEVVLLHGTYATNAPIRFPGNNLILSGLGRTSFIDGDGLATTEHAIVLTGRTDCVIRDLAIQTQDGGGKTCHCIFIEDAADRFLVENVWVVDSDDQGIHIEGTTITNGWILNCKILDTDGDGIFSDMDAANYLDYVQIKNNIILSAGDDSIDLHDTRYAQIFDNVIDESHDDGIQLTTSDDCHITGNTITTSGGYDINITDAASDRTRVGPNTLTGAGTACINDSGTNTRLPTLVFPFVDGTYFLMVDAATWGWEVDESGEYAIATGDLPLNVQQVVRVKVRGVALVTEADAMRLEINGYGGASNEPFTQETIAVANKASVTSNFTANDYIYWMIDPTDDADIGHLLGGDSVMFKVKHEAAGDGDCATNAAFLCVMIEYV